MPTLQEIQKFCNTMQTGVNEFTTSIEDNELRIVMRDMVEDEPSQRTYKAARAVMDTLRGMHGKAITVRSEVIDEWIDVVVKIRE